MAAHRKLTEREAADEIGVHYETLAIWRRQGRIQHRRAGSRIFYLEEDIEAWFEQTKQEPWALQRKAKVAKLG